MKVGIITYSEAVNYGAYLQAFSLGEYLKNEGHEVYYITTFSLKYKYWQIHNLYAYHLNRISFRSEFRHKWKECQKKFCKTNKLYGYDVVIIGSDEMWQLNGKTIKPLPVFWGIGVNAKKVITYAVCSNGTSIDDVHKFDFVSNGINKLDAISVRDIMTEKVFQPFYNNSIQRHLDPTFLINLDKYAISQDIKDYILVYTYSFSAEKIDKTLKFAKSHGLKTVTVGNKFSWSDLSIPASPFEVLGLFADAQFVITDTFHGTVLAVRFRKQFFSFATGNEKIIEFLNEMGLEDYNVSDCDSLSEKEGRLIDYNNIEAKIAEKQKLSYDYLKSNLNECIQV